MSKNIIVVVLVILVAGLVFFKFRPQTKEEMAENKTSTQESSRKMPPAPPKAGDKLSDLPIFQSAYQVFPGDLSDAAKAALTGFDISTVKNADGTTTVTFTPKDSNDKKSSYKVAPGQTLYFIEMTKGDDNADSNTDINLRDDYGVLVDSSGIVQ